MDSFFKTISLCVGLMVKKSFINYTSFGEKTFGHDGVTTFYCENLQHTGLFTPIEYFSKKLHSLNHYLIDCFCLLLVWKADFYKRDKKHHNVHLLLIKRMKVPTKSIIDFNRKNIESQKGDLYSNKTWWWWILITNVHMYTFNVN